MTATEEQRAAEEEIKQLRDRVADLESDLAVAQESESDLRDLMIEAREERDAAIAERDAALEKLADIERIVT